MVQWCWCTAEVEDQCQSFESRKDFFASPILGRSVTSQGLRQHLARIFSGRQSLVSRAKMMSASELLDTPPGVKEKLHLLYQKSKSVEKNMQCFSGQWAWMEMASPCSSPPWASGSSEPVRSLPYTAKPLWPRFLLIQLVQLTQFLLFFFLNFRNAELWNGIQRFRCSKMGRAPA